MVDQLLQEQKNFFMTGKTKDLNFRIQQLSRLKSSIKKYETDILEALRKDLGKPHFEGYATEVGFVLDSIEYMKKNLKKWAKDKKVRTPFHQVLASSRIKSEPYGNILIIGPFNYPFQLLIEPMIGAMAAGNTVVVRPSRHTGHVQEMIVKIIKETFPQKYVAVVTGDRDMVHQLLHSPFDYIFFTGSVAVGKIVMEAASKNLTPVTLELGGKSPTIVHKDANIQVAARRIAWGKFMNTGQTCVAPDYVYVHEDVEDQFKEALANTLKTFYGEEPGRSKDYGRIVSEKEFNRLTAMIDEGKVFYGGNHKVEELYIAPTILHHVTWQDAIMEDEIFGPILPILSYKDLKETIHIINSKPKPLALYAFSENGKVIRDIINSTSSGGVSINDTVSHLVNPRLPFGGVGNAGMGAYHGKYSFDTFSHKKSILKKSTKVDVKLVFPPYNNKLNIIKKVMK